MTTLAQRIMETPMAPYTALLRGMTREQKRIVVTFINESMNEPAHNDKPYEVTPVSQTIKKWKGCASFTEKELENDARLKAIIDK
ncbi:MAG: hypothetical protein IKQ72_02765 [Bacteroidaceae bacterium]|nr:hypothetical protein [Bacteroidaceae bacterium]